MEITIAENRTQRELNQAVKQWLWRFHDLQLEVRRLEWEYQELVQTQESISAINYDGMPKASGSISDLSNMFMARDEALSRLLRAHKRMTTAQLEISEAVALLDTAIERNVISMRYLHYTDDARKMEWVDISQTLGYSLQHVKTTHGIALRKLAQIIGRDRLIGKDKT